MTPEAAKLIRHKFASRAEWRRHVKLANRAPRDPGSPKPFWRIQKLVQDVTDANTALQEAQEKAQAAAVVTPWRVATFWLERKRERALQILAAAALAAQMKAIAARDALLAYRSRGHGRGSPSSFGRAARSKYQPHQGPRECVRRQGIIHET